MVSGFLWLLGLRGFYCLRLEIELSLPPKLVGNMQGLGFLMEAVDVCPFCTSLLALGEGGV